MAFRNRCAELCARTILRSILAVGLISILFLCAGGSRGQETRKLLKKVDPLYPDLARKMNMACTVEVEITIATDGNVHDVQLLGGNPVLATAVEDAVKQWKYASGPAETKKTLEFKF